MKICLIGDCCGKTSIVQRWITPTQNIRDESTIAVEMKTISIVIDNKCRRIQMWDCSGDRGYRTLLDKYIFNAHVIAVCFDLTSLSSWLIAQQWIDRTRSITDAPICIIGNRVDLESRRQVKEKDVKTFIEILAHDLMFYCETSALTGENCIETLHMICREGSRDKKVYTLDDFKPPPKDKCTFM